MLLFLKFEIGSVSAVPVDIGHWDTFVESLYFLIVNIVRKIKDIQIIQLTRLLTGNSLKDLSFFSKKILLE